MRALRRLSSTAGLQNCSVRRHPGLALVEDSVANVVAICQRLGFKSVDCIICGLPWASFPEDLQTHLLKEMISVMSRDGQFVTFAYLQGLLLPAGRRFARLLPQYFSHVSKAAPSGVTCRLLFRVNASARDKFRIIYNGTGSGIQFCFLNWCSIWKST